MSLGMGGGWGACATAALGTSGVPQIARAAQFRTPDTGRARRRVDSEHGSRRRALTCGLWKGTNPLGCQCLLLEDTHRSLRRRSAAATTTTGLRLARAGSGDRRGQEFSQNSDDKHASSMIARLALFYLLRTGLSQSE
jgi:hypothetical protein